MSTVDLNRYKVLQYPLITEKTAGSGGAVFIVNFNSNKSDIKLAIENLFNVKVKKVRVCNYMGKPKRGAKRVVYTSRYKKAYIDLKEGYKIDIVEGI
jgi:large subunit ribosomal protein L23